MHKRKRKNKPVPVSVVVFRLASFILERKRHLTLDGRIGGSHITNTQTANKQKFTVFDGRLQYRAVEGASRRSRAHRYEMYKKRACNRTLSHLIPKVNHMNLATT